MKRKHNLRKIAGFAALLTLSSLGIIGGAVNYVGKASAQQASMQAEFFEALQEHNFDEAAEMLKNGANLNQTCGFNHRCQPLANAAKEGG